MEPDIWFFATSKSGLGHLRRLATIARAVRRSGPGRVLRLVSNAPIEGLGEEDLAAFVECRVVQRPDMAACLDGQLRATAVLDTLALPGIETRVDRLLLVLREAPAEHLDRFRLASGRSWDRVMVANPEDHWMPALPHGFARQVTATGWIYRSVGRRLPTFQTRPPEVLVATGGGGTVETVTPLYARIDHVLSTARRLSPVAFRVSQALGPRAAAMGRLAEADEVVSPGARLDLRFREADVVISTAGYNSVLEIATTDTPALLVAIPRSIDDQVGRARLWGPRLGAWHDDTDPDRAARWLADRIASGTRRPPVNLGPSGEDAAADLILSAA